MQFILENPHEFMDYVWNDIENGMQVNRSNAQIISLLLSWELAMYALDADLNGEGHDEKAFDLLKDNAAYIGHLLHLLADNISFVQEAKCADCKNNRGDTCLRATAILAEEFGVVFKCPDNACLAFDGINDYQ